MSILKKENDMNTENLVNSGRKLKIKIQNKGANGINVSLPIEFVKQITKMGNGISGIIDRDSLDSVKLDGILVLAENGVTG